MAIYFTVDLMTLAARCLYLDRLEETVTVRQIEGQIEQFHSGVDQGVRTGRGREIPAVGNW